VAAVMGSAPALGVVMVVGLLGAWVSSVWSWRRRWLKLYTSDGRFLAGGVELGVGQSHHELEAEAHRAWGLAPGEGYVARRPRLVENEARP